MTSVVNKHLLPIGNQPMIAHPLSIVVRAHFNDTLLVTNPSALGQFSSLFMLDEPPFNQIRPYFTSQSGPLGIANAIKCGREYCRFGPVFVLLGDNRYSDEDIESMVDVATMDTNGFGCHIWCAQRDDPRDYGVLKFEDGKLVDIVEKPAEPPSTTAVTGVYAFDSKVWDFMDKIRPSLRGEYEVTDLIRCYIKHDKVHIHMLEGDWVDLGRSVPAYFKEASKILEV